MRILQYKKYSKEMLISRLRDVTLLHSASTPSPIYVYRNAQIELDYIPVSSIAPSQFYYLESVLSKVGEVEKALRELDIDLFNLEGFVNYLTNENNSIYNLLPVIIEYQMEKDGSINPIVLDGIHRVILAKKKNLKRIKAIKVYNVDKSYPVFGHVNPGGWKDVKLMKTVPPKKYKRLWRFPVDEAYKYYRNFNSAFNNVGEPRK